MKLSIVRTVAAIAVAAALVACGSSNDNTITNPTPNSVTALSSLAFSPATLTATRSAGTVTVTWVFQSVAHTVTWDSQPTGAAVADIGATAGASVSRDFTVAGTYQYHCSIHPFMLGTIIIQ
jgi:plastocyanin